MASLSSIIRYDNFTLLCNLPRIERSGHVNLTVDSSGKLSIISRYNLVGRLIKWIQNRDGSIHQRVDQLVVLTLQETDQMPTGVHPRSSWVQGVTQGIMGSQRFKPLPDTIRTELISINNKEFTHFKDVYLDNGINEALGFPD